MPDMQVKLKPQPGLLNAYKQNIRQAIDLSWWHNILMFKRKNDYVKITENKNFIKGKHGQR